MNLYLKYLSLVLLALLRLALAQPPPSLDCVKILTPTEDSLTWNSTLACDTFVVWAATNEAGPYAAVDTSDTLISGIIHTKGFNDIVWYFLTCLGSFIPASDTVDNVKPITPLFIRITVTPSDKVALSWEVSPSPETHGYIVYRDDPGPGVVPIDTVYGRFNTSYTDLNANPQDAMETYSIAAIDSCLNLGDLSVKPHNTIHLEPIVLDSCRREANLLWNVYKNWVGGVIDYQVLVSINGDTFILVSPPLNDKIAFIYTGLTDDDTLCFKIRALNAAGVSSVSNTVCITFDVVKPISFTYLTSLSVSQNKSVILKWLADSTADIRRFSIERSLDGQDFDAVFSLLAPAELNVPLTYTDPSVFPGDQPYFYRVVSFDNCEIPNTSNVVRTQFLTGTSDNFVNMLDWNTVFLEDIGYYDATYDIFREVNGIWTVDPIVSFSDSMTYTYTDSIQDFISASGKYDYVVVANYIEGANNTSQRSFSNIYTLAQPWQIFVPNAFIPNATIPVNRTFKPVITFIDVFTYRLEIYNRGGQLVFTSNDMDKGWDGTYKGKELPSSVYIYKLEIVDRSGFPFDKRGTVMIIR